MTGSRILIIEDDSDIIELLEYNLTREGYRVEAARSGEDGLQRAQSSPPDLIILDLMLPGTNGLEVCRALKKETRTDRIPVVMLTAKSDEADIVAGLELGADDYITKPFSPRVLLARLRAVMRRREAGSPDDAAVIHIHELVINPGRHEVLVGNRGITLTNTEFRLLHSLAQHPGWVFTRYQIVNNIRGEEAFVTDRTVDVHVAGLRKKLGEAGRHIETIRGVGYRFRELI
jgi:two-component system alkaline phosphatase synthesis response regulator PhoP